MCTADALANTGRRQCRSDDVQEVDTAMGRISLWMQVSLDGIADTQDDAPWPIIDEELHAPFLDELHDTDVFIHGRRTYELMASFWPMADIEPAISEFYIDFARVWKKTCKLVLSRTLDVVDWNSRVVRRNPIEEITALRTQTDFTAIILGGPRTATTLMKAGLVDEYQLFVHPVVLGDGESLLPRTEHRSELQLIDTSAYDSGVVRLHYSRIAPAPASSDRLRAGRRVLPQAGRAHTEI